MSHLVKKHIDFFIYGIMLVMSVLLVSCSTDDPDEIHESNAAETNNTTNNDLDVDDEDDDDNDEEDDEVNEDDEDVENETPGNTEEKNILKNGDLEKWEHLAGTSSVWPWGWSVQTKDVSINWKIVYEGNYSARLESKKKGTTATIRQLVPVEPSSKLRIRFHYYVEQWKDKGARTYCYFRTRAAEVSTISADELKAFYDKNTYYIIRGGGYGLTYLPHNLNVWQVFDETIQVPPTATYFVFGVNSYYGTTIYVDDCYVAQKKK